MSSSAFMVAAEENLFWANEAARRGTDRASEGIERIVEGLAEALDVALAWAWAEMLSKGEESLRRMNDM